MKNLKLDGRADIIEFIRDELGKLPKGSLVLDAAAGDPDYQVRVDGHHYYTVDLCVGDINWRYNLIDVIGNLEQLPFRDGSFDAVICTEVLEHMRDPQTVLSEICRATKKGGKVFVSAPMEKFVHQAPYDFFRYTPYGFARLFEVAGFSSWEIMPIGGYFRLMAAQIAYVKTFLLPKSDNLFIKVLRYPIKILFIVFIEFILAHILYLMDGLDKKRLSTIGHKAVAVK